MELRVLSDDGNVIRLQLVGHNVQSESPPSLEVLDKVLGSEGYARRVLLSLAETRFIDSSGLSWLVVCHKRFCQGGGKLVVHSLSPALIDLLKMMRLDLALFVAEDESAALELARKE
ncbi:MAG: STAS domain-containing protein [Planctomycetota bacterium]